ncbi:MAG: methyltransferase domain-containing protein [Anaerolineae bacterium]|nr:methyltransferase domain-containing protein [Anaerolineae bacterium]
MVDKATLHYMTRNEASPAFRRRVFTVFEWLDPQDGDVIFDGGCGRGFYLKMFRHVCKARLIGLELDPDIIQKARRNVGHLPGVTLVRAGLDHIPLPDASVDKAVLSEILEHVKDDAACLREVRRILRPGGVLAITVPHANYPFWWDPINKTLEAVTGRHIRRGPLAGIWANHERLYRPEQLRQVVVEAGFIVEEERATTHYCFPFIHNLVYGLGKPLLESGLLPRDVAASVDRAAFAEAPGRRFSLMGLALAALNFFDRPNVMSEPPGRATVNLCIKAQKPDLN